MEYKCKYCGKICKSLNGLKHHEPYCSLNPNKKEHHSLTDSQKYSHVAWNKGLTKENNNIVKQSALKRNNTIQSGNYKKNPHYWTDEEKINLSNKRKEYLKNNPDKHVWKRNNKFKSKPCELFKEYLKNKKINFVEEYTPLTDYNYSLDIAWPDIKIAIEINGNQHYNKDGSLTDYYQNRHNILESNGWKIYEIHYTKCYNININDFNDILQLNIYDKDYVNSYFTKKEKNNIIKQQKLISKEKKYNAEYNIIKNLIENSGIDFSKRMWSKQASKYLKSRNELWNKGIFRCIRKYFPDFLKQDNVWKRKGSKY